MQHILLALQQKANHAISFAYSNARLSRIRVELKHSTPPPAPTESEKRDAVNFMDVCRDDLIIISDLSHEEPWEHARVDGIHFELC